MDFHASLWNNLGTELEDFRMRGITLTRWDQSVFTCSLWREWCFNRLRSDPFDSWFQEWMCFVFVVVNDLCEAQAINQASNMNLSGSSYVCWTFHCERLLIVDGFFLRIDWKHSWSVHVWDGVLVSVSCSWV